MKEMSKKCSTDHSERNNFLKNPYFSALLTSVHLKRLLTSKSSNILSVIWLNPGFVKISSNILFCFDYEVCLELNNWRKRV